MNIIKIQYDGQTTFIKFMDDNNAQYSLKCEETPRPEFSTALKELTSKFKGWAQNPISNASVGMILDTIEYKSKDGDIEKFKLVFLVKGVEKLAFDMTVPNIPYPCDNKDINNLIIRINEEANKYINGHRAQMGIFEGDEEA